MPAITDDMVEKEKLAKHFVSLICSDTLSSWRSLSRPASLPQTLPDQALDASAASIKRVFKAANYNGKTRAGRARVARSAGKQVTSSDKPDFEERTLFLGAASIREKVATNAIEAQSGVTLPGAGGDVGGTGRAVRDNGGDKLNAFGDDEGTLVEDQLRALGVDDEASVGALSDDDDDESVFGVSRQSDASTHATSPDASLEEPGDTKECKECKDIETQWDAAKSKLSEAQEEMYAKLRDRADETSTGRALEEVFFREGGLDRYRPIRAEMGRLAEDLARLKLRSKSRAAHTCRPAAVR